MQIDVREAAELFAVSEKTIYRWIKAGSLPGYRVQGQYRFNRAELLEWATSRSIPIDPALFEERPVEGADALPAAISLAAALETGGIHRGVHGDGKPETLATIVELVPLPPSVDRKLLLHVLLSRESLGSTGIGDGIAIPHVRNPIVLHATTPTITLCFLEHPIDFASLDGRPVHTLFTIVAPSIWSHLQLLSRLAHALRAPMFREVIGRQADDGTILAAAAELDRALGSGPAAREKRSR
jgi:PTS system nitrogen regulatory IIA component